jgi:uncharacterized membrane protein
MRTPTIILLLTLTALSLTAIPTNALTDTGIAIDTQTAAITIADNGLHVEETITLTNHATDNATILRFWVQNDPQSLSIVTTKTGTALTPIANGNIWECNLTQSHTVLEPSASIQITVSYRLPTNTPKYETQILYNTSSLTVSYDTQTLFTGTDLVRSNDVIVQLYTPTEAPLGLSTLVIVFLVVVIILALLLLVFRRQRRRKRVGTLDTSEALTTKKDLLLELLKELEKRYRAKDISDETYTKLKEEYKAQAVDAMRRLEDVKKPGS